MSKKIGGIRLLKYGDQFKSYRAGDIIFQEGDEGRHMYVVKAGVVELHVAGMVIETLESGDILGEMALLDDDRRSATALALTDCQIVSIDKAQFEYLVRQTPNFAIDVMHIMAERLRRMNRQTTIIKKSEVQ